jgi:hypothetical protein
MLYLSSVDEIGAPYRPRSISRLSAPFHAQGKPAGDGPALTPPRESDRLGLQTRELLIACSGQSWSCSTGAYEIPMTAPSGDCCLATV